MFQMNPYQSQTTLLVLILLVAAVIWLAIEYKKLVNKRALLVKDSTTDAPLAVVTDMRTRKPVRHLSIVPDLNEASSPALYDWEVQGL